MKYPEPFKQYIRDMARFCADQTYHGRFEISMGWEPDTSDVDTDNTSCPFSCLILFEYLTINIDVYPVALKMWKAKDYRQIAKSVLHEVCHLIHDPLQHLALDNANAQKREEVRKATEEQTSHLTVVLWRLFEMAHGDGWYMPKVKK